MTSNNPTPSHPPDFIEMRELGKKEAILSQVPTQEFCYYVFGKLAHLEKSIQCNKTWHNTVAKEENSDHKEH